MTTPPLEVTTDAIRSLTIYAAMQDPAGTEEQAGAIFDEWLARVTRQAKAEALREAAAAFREDLAALDPNNPSELAYINCSLIDAGDLEIRASRIEAGE